MIYKLRSRQFSVTLSEAEVLSADTVGASSDHASQKTRTKTQVVAEVSSLSYEDSEEDDEEDEAFQQELALLTQKFNRPCEN